MTRYHRILIFLIYTLLLVTGLLVQSTRAQADHDKTSRTTVNLIKSLANSGRAEAQHTLAQLYFNGNGVEQSYEKALEWFSKAAEQGHTDSQNSLGMMYANGIGVDINCDKAQKWFSSIKPGTYIYQQAQANLAWLLATCPQASYRNGQKALSISQNLLRQNQEANPNLLDTLAAAYAETGQFQRAREIQQRAIALLSQDPAASTRLDRFNQRLEFYQTNKPWRNTGN